MTVKTMKIINVVRKRIFAEAVRVTDDNMKLVAEWCEGEIRIDPTAKGIITKQYIKIQVQHSLNARQTKAYSGDWILKTDKGIKAYQNDPFKNNFDFVTPQNESTN